MTYFSPSTQNKFLIVFFTVMICNGAIAQLTAKFTYNPISPCLPVDAQFFDQSTGNPTSWYWDFGDGTSSTLKNPLKTYSSSGSFSVTLSVTNMLGSSTIQKINLININPPPIANFSASPQKGCFPIGPTFTDLSTTSTGKIVAWAWDFGDGSTSDVQNPSYTYTDTGSYDVSFYVVNSDGCGSGLAKASYIQIGDTVTSGFNSTLQPFCQSSKPYQFTSPVSSIPLSYLWDFGDGSTSTQANPLHTYTSVGTFSVKLVANNSYGCSATTLKTNLIKVDTILTDFTLPLLVCPGSAAAFANISTPATINSQWDFGDGTTSNVSSPIKTFTSAGSYKITLTNSFANGCSVSTKKTLTVLAKPTVAFSANKTAGCQPPLNVVFTSTSGGATNLQWDFGDGTTGTGTSVAHIYTTTGVFSVKLIASNANGCKDSSILTNYINLFPPTASIGLASSDGCVSFAIAPVANINSAEPIVSYLWSFGDGSPTSTSATPSHTYITAGSFTLSLSIATTGGCSYTTSRTIRVGTIPSPSTNISPNPACAKQPVVFLDQTKFGAVNFWDFGDNTTSTLQNVAHTYAQPGTYTIKYTVDNNGCKKDFVLTNYVKVLPPLSNFTYAQSCKDPFNFSFDPSTSTGALQYQWSFGDNATDITANPTHTYTSGGNFTVRLITTNLTCSDTIYKTLNINLNPTSFTASNTNICKNNSISFNASYNTPSYVAAYVWDFGDGTAATTTDNIISHTFTSSGIFSIRLIVKNNFGCADTVYKQNLVFVNGPTSGFSVANPTGCKNRLVTFNDSSKTDGRHIIIKWQWDFGDGSNKTYTSPPFNHLYLTSGNYTVKLITTDASGCQDSVQIANAVVTSSPAVGFTAVDTLSCPLSKIQLQPDVLDLNATYIWYTGNGQPLVGSPVYVSFTDSGLHTIKLVVKDNNNCSDSLSKVNYISIKQPFARFTESDSFTICSSLNIKFTNKSYYYNSYSWDFGNGIKSTQSSPYVRFTTGNYNVKLKVTSPGGCTDSLMKPVYIYAGAHNFTYSPVAGCQPLVVSFKLSVPTKGSYVWDFNDGTSSSTTDSSVTKAYTEFGPYLPRVTFRETSGCTLTFSDTNVINVVGVKASFGLQQKVCSLQTESFTDSSISTGVISYHWDFGDGNSSTQQSPSYNYKSPGVYLPRLVVSSGVCADTLVKKVFVFTVPNATIRGDSLGCAPFTTSLYANFLVADTSAITSNWDFGNGQTSTSATPSQTYTDAGTYTIKLHTLSANGCMADTFQNILVDPVSKINAGNDTTVCFGVTVQLHASGTNTYKWLPPTNSQLSCTNCANPIAKISNPVNTFVVQDTGITGCFAADTVTVKYLNPYNVTFKSVTDSVCSGQPVQLIATGAQLYNWTPASTLNSANIATPIATPIVSTYYVLTATDTVGCQVFKDSILITAIPNPTINIGRDTVIASGSVLQFNPVISADIVNYFWTPPTQLSCRYCAAPLATPKFTTTYKVTVSNFFGCTATDDVTITVLCSNNNVFFPNLFTPNGDGVNDIFYPRGTGLFRVKTFKVFNRWGQLMFVKDNFFPNDASQGWTGKTSDGRSAAADVYTYTAEIYCDNNTLITINGNITVVY